MRTLINRMSCIMIIRGAIVVASGSDLPSGFREHSYRVFAKWINPYTQRVYYFVKESSQPLDYQMGDIVPATINPEHTWSRYLNI